MRHESQLTTDEVAEAIRAFAQREIRRSRRRDDEDAEDVLRAAEGSLRESRDIYLDPHGINKPVDLVVSNHF